MCYSHRVNYGGISAASGEHMKKGSVKTYLLLFLAATVWGFGFVAQSSGMDHVGPFTFNAVRLLIGSLSLVPLIAVLKGKALASCADDEAKAEVESEFSIKRSLRAGVLCGIPLFIAIMLQQYGLIYVGTGECSFLTALYMVLIPIFGIFIGKKVPRKIWLCVLVAIAGMYLLCMQEGTGLSKGSLLVIGCAALFAVQMLTVDRQVNNLNPVLLSSMEFLTAGLFACVGMFIVETPRMSDILAAALPILYSGLVSCGVGYTLQTVGQRNAEPTMASLILSLESVVGAIGGWLLLGETLSLRQIIGCAVIFAAACYATVPKGYFRSLRAAREAQSE